MKIIGICGGSGSGKGAVCSAFLKLGIPSIDTDAVYHALTSSLTPCLCELAREFGEGIIKDGALNRAALRDIVFSGDGARDRQLRLNEITHKYVIEETKLLLSGYERSGALGAIIDAPLLFESGLDLICDKVVAVVAERELRVARIVERDGIDSLSALRRISAQISDSELCERCDYVILNNGTLEELEANVIKTYSLIFN